VSLRILFATHAPSDSKTAVYRSVAQQAQHLQSEGHYVHLLTRGDLASARWARFDPILLPLLLIRRDLSAYDAVVFHSYLGWAFHLLRRWLDPRGRAATITWFHGLEPLYHRAASEEYRRDDRRPSLRFRLLHHILLPRLLKASCRRSDGVFCFNSIEAEYLAAHRWARSERIHRVSNGVETDCFHSRRHNRVAKRLLFVGQWLLPKGTRYLIDAFTSLAALGDFELACVGTGAPSEEVLSEFPAAVRSRVIVRSRVDRPELYEQLRAADIFLFPTLSEGFSCALLEAMAAELPVVTTPVGAAVDLIEDGRHGVLVRRADASALVKAVARLAEDIETRTALGSSARQAASRFTTRATGVEFASRLLDIVNRRGSATAKSAVVHPDAA
jgi:glycosyltransferase involved in cell wall biosynthesis